MADLHIQIPDDLKAELSRQAQREGTTMKAVVIRRLRTEQQQPIDWDGTEEDIQSDLEAMQLEAWRDLDG